MRRSLQRPIAASRHGRAAPAVPLSVLLLLGRCGISSLPLLPHSVIVASEASNAAIEFVREVRTRLMDVYVGGVGGSGLF